MTYASVDIAIWDDRFKLDKSWLLLCMIVMVAPGGTSPLRQPIFRIVPARRQATPAGTPCRFQHEQKNGVQLLARKVSIPFSMGCPPERHPAARACQGHFKDVTAKPRSAR